MEAKEMESGSGDEGGQAFKEFERGHDDSVMGRVEHWCSSGATLERFDARVYHGPQQSAIPSVPSSNRAYSFPVHGFPMFFVRTPAPVSSQLSLEA